MLQDAARLGGALVGLPVGLVAQGVARAISGSGAVLRLDYRAPAELVERAELVHRLRRAAVDPGVAGVVVRWSELPSSWAAAHDLREALGAVRAAGKGTWALLVSPSHVGLWLASAAEHLALVPTGEVLLLGLGAQVLFFRTALDRVGLEADLEAAGEYKAFGERFQRTHASPAHQENLQQLVDELQGHLVSELAASRGLDEAVVLRAMDAAPLAAARAREIGLVDSLAYPDQLEDDILSSRAGARFLDFSTWARVDAIREWAEERGHLGPTVAVVHLEGPIVVDERRRRTSIRSRKVVPVLRKLREDDGVAAVVLHVNSPGGSSLASDLIWREVEQLAAVKPVVASFEGVAASGGYYLSAPATEILARPGTLTGSIGVFGGKVVVREGLRRAGVAAQSFGTSDSATMFSPHARFTDRQRARFREMLDRTYDAFVERVATGRGRERDEVEPHCRGRVWTGVTARERGLVDGEGDLDAAILRAAELASLARGRVQRRDLLPSQDRSLVGRAMKASRSAALVELDPLVQLVDPGPQLGVLLAHPEQALAMLPWELRLR